MITFNVHSPLVLSLLLSLSSAALAAPFPKGCRQQGFAFDQGQLTMTPTNEDASKQTLYLLYNKSNRDVSVHAIDKQYALLGMNWKMTLQADTWSAFAVDKEHIQFDCQNENGDFVSCGQALELCEYNRAVFGEGIVGSYWVMTNKPLESVVSKSIKNGILLRW